MKRKPKSQRIQTGDDGWVPFLVRWTYRNFWRRSLRGKERRDICWWFRDPKANHRLDVENPVDHMDKLPTSTGWQDIFHLSSINSISKIIQLGPSTLGALHGSVTAVSIHHPLGSNCHPNWMVLELDLGESFEMFWGGVRDLGVSLEFFFYETCTHP